MHLMLESDFDDALFHLVILSGNDIEQTANTYKPNACNKALIKTTKTNLSNLD